MDRFLSVLEKVQEVVWGPPTMLLLLATGLYFTVRLKGLQITKLALAIRYIFQKEEGIGFCISLYRAGSNHRHGEYRRGCHSFAGRRSWLFVLDVGICFPWNGDQICRRCAGSKIQDHG